MKRKKHACQDTPMPVWDGTGPKIPPPPFTASSLESRLREIEARLGITDAPAPASPQGPAQPDYVPPAGIVSPHVRQNLGNLAEWMNPQRVWGLQSAGEAKRVEALLTHLHGLVMVAMAGGDVPHPDEPAQ